MKCEICILAGGLSSRMGRDKARLRLQGKTLLGWVRQVAKETGLPIRVIRKDLVKRCGPLSGIFTALKTSRVEGVIFLACDMPFVESAFLWRLQRALKRNDVAVFTDHEEAKGFPFILRREMLGTVEKHLREKRFSIQALAKNSRAIRCPEKWRLMNLNTPEEWMAAKERLED